jgi:hypothetical protein
MKETIDWLQSKAYLITYVGASSLQKTIEGKHNGKWEVVLASPCTIEFRNSSSQPEGSTSQAGSHKQKPEDESKRDGGPHGVRTRQSFYVSPPENPSVITIPLSSLNPKKTGTTVFNGNVFTGGNVFVATTDDKEAIVWRGADKTFNAKSIIIGFEQDGLPERVSKALNHAINMCGGRVDKKEPF